jgi:hypothetical protein
MEFWRKIKNWAWGIPGNGKRERGMVRQAHQPGERLNLSLFPLPFNLYPLNFPLPPHPPHPPISPPPTTLAS